MRYAPDVNGLAHIQEREAMGLDRYMTGAQRQSRNATMMAGWYIRSSYYDKRHTWINEKWTEYEVWVADMYTRNTDQHVLQRATQVLREARTILKLEIGKISEIILNNLRREEVRAERLRRWALYSVLPRESAKVTWHVQAVRITASESVELASFRALEKLRDALKSIS